MSTKMIAGSVWGKITSLSRQSKSAMIAVPYFGRGATELIKLRTGHTLVIRFNLESVKSGQVDPSEVITAIQQGAKVYSCANLHAKVFAFDKSVVIGSANVSRNSESVLIEACTITSDKKVLIAARKFVTGLRGDSIGIDYAKSMKEHYRPPVFGQKGKRRAVRKNITPEHSMLWWTVLEEGSKLDTQDKKYETRGKDGAQGKIKNKRLMTLDHFQWEGVVKYRLGERIIQEVTTQSGKVLVEAPARIIYIQKYMKGGKQHAFIFLEKPKKYRRRDFKKIKRKLGPLGKKISKITRDRRLRNRELIYSLGRLWT